MVPGDIFAPTSIGPLQMIQEGAWPITVPRDILKILGIDDVEKNYSQIVPAPFDELLKLPRYIDELVAESGRTSSEVRSLLTQWEIAGGVKIDGQGRYYIY